MQFKTSKAVMQTAQVQFETSKAVMQTAQVLSDLLKVLRQKKTDEIIVIIVKDKLLCVSG